MQLVVHSSIKSAALFSDSMCSPAITIRPDKEVQKNLELFDAVNMSQGAWNLNLIIKVLIGSSANQKEKIDDNVDVEAWVNVARII